MNDRTIPTTHRRMAGGWARRSAVTTLVVLVASVAGVTVAGASGAQLQRATVQSYRGILENATHHTLYALSSERGARLHCRAACLTSWPPMLVKSSTKKITIGGGVMGTVGFVRRSSTMKQVTFNGYPLYTFSGDSGPGHVSGQGIVADGGTWYLVNATARTTYQTLKRRADSAVTTTTAGSSYGY